MRLVITGAAGQVGGFLAAEAGRRGREVVALTSSQWDITDPGAADRIVESGDVVVNCAAFTHVDAAETDRARAQAVNADGPGHVAAACARAGARMIHISTDFVFSGSARRPYEPGDETAPLSVYGHTKLAGERAVLAALPQATVVRTAWVYTGDPSPQGTDFVATMRRLALREGAVEVVDDQIGSPTYVGDLASALLQVVDARVDAPVVHAANEGAVSRYELACAVFAGVGADPSRVRPVSSDHHRRPAARPYYSALSGRLSAQAGLTPLRPWRDALAQALATRPLPSTRE